MRVLVVDDERLVADTLVMILESAGHEARAVYNGASAVALIETFPPDCLISDVIMPGIDGTQVCTAVEASYPNCYIFLFSGQVANNEFVEKARKAGHCWELMAKPIEPEELLERLEGLSGKAKLRA